jgi:oligoribonuclease
MRKNGTIFWVDLEMTGLRAEDDLILEVASIITDWNFKEIDSYQGIVKHQKDELVNRMSENAAFWDKNQVSRDALIKQNDSGKDLYVIEKELLNFIDKNFKPDAKIVLAGNSVHMDRRFISKYWPALENKLYYRMLDVSALKLVFENKFNKHFSKPDNHRALDDIRGSIEELNYYIGMIHA